MSPTRNPLARHSGGSQQRSWSSRNPAPCSFLLREVQSFVSPAASRLLFGMTPGVLPFAAPRPAPLFAPLLRRGAQKVTKKARHRTRCFAAHRARQNALCFSGTAGSSESTSLCWHPTRAPRARAPAGFFRRSLRCSAPRKAPLSSTNPCIPALRFCDRSLLCKSGEELKECKRLLLQQGAAQTGPLWRGERVEEKPEGASAGSARGRCGHTDVRSATPGTRSRTRRAGCPEGAQRGVCFFRLPFFAQAKKGDSLARRASESFAPQKIGARSWIPAFAGMTSGRATYLATRQRAINVRKEAIQ